MSAAESMPGLPATRSLFLIALAAAILLAGGVVLSPSAVAKGWLAGFVFWSSAPIGAVALALIHEATGGRWGVAAAPTLRLGCVCALTLPLFFAVFAPFVGLVYPWARDAGSVPPDVSRLFLNAALFGAYGLIALVGWAVIAALRAGGRLGLLGVSLALVFHGVAISAVAVAWLLSLDQRFADSAFGAEIAVQQNSACARRRRRACAIARCRRGEGRHRRLAVRDGARRLLPRPHDFHRQLVRRPAG